MQSSLNKIKASLEKENVKATEQLLECEVRYSTCAAALKAQHNESRRLLAAAQVC